MAFFDFIENFFFISLGITFVLILLLVYHFKQRISSMERKGDTMYELITNIVKEMRFMKSPYCNSLFCSSPSSEEPSTGVATATPSSPEIVGGGELSKDAGANNERGGTSYSQNATAGACSELRKDAGANNERGGTSYSQNATAGACSELRKDAKPSVCPFPHEDNSSPSNIQIVLSESATPAVKHEGKIVVSEDESSDDSSADYASSESELELDSESDSDDETESVSKPVKKQPKQPENVPEDAFTYEDTSSPANTRTTTCSDVAFRGSCANEATEADDVREAEKYVPEKVNEDNYALNTYGMNEKMDGPMDGQMDESDFLSGLNISPDELMGFFKQHGLESSANELFGDLGQLMGRGNNDETNGMSDEINEGIEERLNNFASKFDASMFYPKININPETDDTMGLEDLTLDIETIDSDALFTYEDTSSAANEQSGPIGAYSELHESSPEIINVVDTTTATDTEVHATNVPAPAAPEPEPEKKNTREVYRKMNITQLRAIATAAGIQADTGKLKKNDLIQLLENLEE
jgi:hypothetical protein